MKVEFTEATHEYRCNGVVLPSVTQILGDLSFIKRLDPALLQRAAERGRRVHKACELYDFGDLDESSIDPADAPYLEAWKRFRTDWRFMFRCGEKPLCSKRWGFAGKPDCWGTIEHKRQGLREVVVDRKTGESDAVHGPQTAAYVELLRENEEISADPPLRYAVRLQPNGHYEVDRFDDPADWPTFMAALTVYRFKERRGLL